MEGAHEAHPQADHAQDPRRVSVPHHFIPLFIHLLPPPCLRHCSSDFFGEVAILKDQPRSTSAIASNRCVLLSLDRNEFLHLISYGSSNIDGSSIDDEDRRFNEIISKYIGE